MPKLRMEVCFMFRYRTYRRPRYKVAYKMVTEMEWKCCHGYSGEDCHDGPKVTTDSQVTGGRPHSSQTGHSSNGGHTGGSVGGSGGKRTTYPSIYSSDILLGHKRPTPLCTFSCLMLRWYCQDQTAGGNYPGPDERTEQRADHHARN